MNLDQADTVREKVLALLRQSPREQGVKRSRWRLDDILPKVSDFLRVGSKSGLWRVLQRLGIG